MVGPLVSVLVEFDDSHQHVEPGMELVDGGCQLPGSLQLHFGPTNDGDHQRKGKILKKVGQG